MLVIALVSVPLLLFSDIHAGNTMLITLVVPLVIVFLDGWYWSKRASWKEMILSVLFVFLSFFFVYGYFSGSYQIQGEGFTFPLLASLPFLFGAGIARIFKKF